MSRPNPFAFNPAWSLVPEPDLPNTLLASLQGGRSQGLSGSQAFGSSLLLHFSVLLLAFLLLFLSQWLGFKLSIFDWTPTDMTPEIEMVIVHQPTEKPKVPNTKRRAQFDSRAGGESVVKKLTQTLVAAPTQAPQQAAPPAQAQPQQNKPTPAEPPSPPVAKPVPHPSKQPATKSKPIAVKSQTATTTHTTAEPSDVEFDAPGPIVTRSKRSSSSSPSQLGPKSLSVASNPSASAAASKGSRYSSLGGADGGGGPAGLDALASVDLGAYINDIEKRVRRNWSPADADSSRNATFRLVIARNGGLLSCTLTHSSGSGAFDTGAKAAIQASAPFRSFPPGVRDSQITILFKLDYALH